jgi:hypothetical protein
MRTGGVTTFLWGGMVRTILELAGKKGETPRAGGGVPNHGSIGGARRAHPVRGKDRSPPGSNNPQYSANLLSAHKCGPRAQERRFVMPVRRLPAKPNLEHLKYQAKDLLREHAGREPGAAQRIREFHPRFGEVTDAEIFNARFSLSDAQQTIARESGFPSWTRLKRHIEKPELADRLNLPHQERIEDAAFRRAVELLDAGDAAGLREHLKRHAELFSQSVTFGICGGESGAARPFEAEHC